MELIEKIIVDGNKIEKRYYINGVLVPIEDYGDALEACENEVDENCGCENEYSDYVDELMDDCIEDCIEIMSNPEGICEDCLKRVLHSLYMEGYREGSIDARLGLIGQLSDEIEEFEED